MYHEIQLALKFTASATDPLLSGLATALPYICIATGLHDLLAPWWLDQSWWNGFRAWKTWTHFEHEWLSDCKKWFLRIFVGGLKLAEHISRIMIPVSFWKWCMIYFSYHFKSLGSVHSSFSSDVSHALKVPSDGHADKNEIWCGFSFFWHQHDHQESTYGKVKSIKMRIYFCYVYFLKEKEVISLQGDLSRLMKQMGRPPSVDQNALQPGETRWKLEGDGWKNERNDQLTWRSMN